MDKALEAQLRGYADEVLKYVKSELTHDGAVDPAVWVPFEGKIRRLDLGPFKKMIDSARGKDLLFRAVGGMVRERGLDCVVFVSEAWLGKSTPKGLALGYDELNKRAGKAKKGLTDLVADGLITRSEVIMVTVQTESGTLLIEQPFERDQKQKSIRFGECNYSAGDGALTGRLADMKPKGKGTPAA